MENRSTSAPAPPPLLPRNSSNPMTRVKLPPCSSLTGNIPSVPQTSSSQPDRMSPPPASFAHLSAKVNIAPRQWDVRKNQYHPPPKGDVQDMPRRKRRAVSLDEPQAAAVSDNSTQEHEPCPSKSHKAKCRKPTYLIRKEEKETLSQQVQALQSQLEFLQQRAGVVEWQSKDASLLQKEIDNKKLREQVSAQQNSLFGLRSLISGLNQSGQQINPVTSTIRLTKDWNQRYATLMNMKSEKIQTALRLMAERVQFVDCSEEYSENARFTTSAQESCLLRFDSTPMTGWRSVRQATDTFSFLIRNIEMVHKMKPTLGKGVDISDNGILHRRLLAVDVDDASMETNFVVFSETLSDSKSVFVFDVVEDDELHPYDPSQKVRHDVSGIVTIESLPKRGNKEERVITITRWMLLKLYPASFQVSSDTWDHMREMLGEVGDSVLRAVKKTVDENNHVAEMANNVV